MQPRQDVHLHEVLGPSAYEMAAENKRLFRTQHEEGTGSVHDVSSETSFYPVFVVVVFFFYFMVIHKTGITHSFVRLMLLRHTTHQPRAQTTARTREPPFTSVCSCSWWRRRRSNCSILFHIHRIRHFNLVAVSLWQVDVVR